MDRPPPELVVPIYVVGARRHIYAYKTADGRVPAREFLDGLDKKSRARYWAHFQVMGDTGMLAGKFWHPWKRAGRGMSAFKDNGSQTRIPAFPDGEGVLILTGGISGKNEDEIPERDVNAALRAMQDYKTRKPQLRPPVEGRAGEPRRAATGRRRRKA